MNIKHVEDTLGKERTLNAEFINETVTGLNLDKASNILDVGTGWGLMSIILASNGYKVLTGEPERTLTFEEKHLQNHDAKLMSWRDAAKDLGIDQNILFQYFDVESLPFRDNNFDCVFMYNTLHHVSDKKKAIRECLRVLNSMGVLCVIENNSKGHEYLRKKHGSRHLALDITELIDNYDVVRIIEGEYSDAYIWTNIEENEV